MNDWDDSNESEGMKNMRKQLKELAKQNKELLENQKLYENRTREVLISTTLASHGLDPRVAKFYPADLGADQESVDKWYNENKDVFGPAQPASTPPQDQGTALSDAEQRGYQAMQDMGAYDARVVQDFKSQMDQIRMDGPYDGERATAELMALLKANGVNTAT